MNVIKTAHRTTKFLKTLVSQEIFVNICASKNILEYDQITKSGPKFMIIDIEGHSTTYTYRIFKLSKFDKPER